MGLLFYVGPVGWATVSWLPLILPLSRILRIGASQSESLEGALQIFANVYQMSLKCKVAQIGFQGLERVAAIAAWSFNVVGDRRSAPNNDIVAHMDVIGDDYGVDGLETFFAGYDAGLDRKSVV